MEIQKVTAGEAHELLVKGRIDGSGANQLETEILGSIRAGAREILVNLSEATFLCSAGIRALLQYYRQMKTNQKRLMVTQPSSIVESILETTGFKDIIVESPKPRA
jgi:anti-anti-sigma factor